MGLNYLFIFPLTYVALWGSKAHHRLSSESVSWCLETSLFLKTPFPGRISVPTSFASLFICYIFSYLLLKTMAAFLSAWCPLSAFRSCFVEFTQRSNVLWWICWGESSFPVLFLCYFRTAPKITHNSHEINRTLKTILPC